MPGAVEEIIARRFGGRCAVESETVTVGASVGVVLKNDPERVAWLLVNTGSEDAHVAWQRPAASPDAVPVVANGGSLAVNVEDDFILPTWELVGRAAVVSTTLHVISVRRVSQ